MAGKDNDVPGNAVLSAALLGRQVERLGIAALRMDAHLEKLQEQGIEVKALRFVYRGGVRGEVLCVVTAHTENGGIVAFHNGDTFGEVMKGIAARMGNGSLKWKEDEYADQT